MTTATLRLDYLDALRAFALILGVVFHAGLSFMPVFIGWAVMDINTSPAMGIFSLISHSFRMPLFFLIAGLFTHMSLQKYGIRTLITSRALRLGVPFIGGWFLLKPLLVSGWVMGAQSMRGDASITAGLWQGLNSLTELPAGIFTGTHLWFLYYLMLVTGITVVAITVLKRMPLLEKVLTAAGRAVMTWLCCSRVGFILLSLPVACCLWWMEHWGLDTPDKSLWPDLPLLLLYGGSFLMGWIFYQQDTLLCSFMQITWSKVGWLVACVLGAVSLSGYEMVPGHPYYFWFKAGFVVCYAGMMWMLMALLMAGCKKLFSRPSAIIRYVSSRAYWLYLIHLPIVVWLQVAFAELPLHWLIKLGSITFITLAVSVVLYNLVVKRSWLRMVFAGAGKPTADKPVTG